MTPPPAAVHPGPVEKLTPETWPEAMLKALDNYRAELLRWAADKSPENARRLDLASAHVAHVEKLRPEPTPPATEPTAASSATPGAKSSPRE